MIVKAEVTPEEKAMICGYAKQDGKSISAYLKSRALCEPQGHSNDALMQGVEVLSSVAQSINRLVMTALRNKIIYEEEILELLQRMTALENTTAEILKEVRKNGNPRKQKRKGDAPRSSEV